MHTISEIISSEDLTIFMSTSMISLSDYTPNLELLQDKHHSLIMLTSSQRFTRTTQNVYPCRPHAQCTQSIFLSRLDYCKVTPLQQNKASNPLTSPYCCLPTDPKVRNLLKIIMNPGLYHNSLEPNSRITWPNLPFLKIHGAYLQTVLYSGDEINYLCHWLSSNDNGRKRNMVWIKVSLINNILLIV